MISSVLTPFCTNTTELYAMRFIQGLTVAIASIGSRTLVLDHFSGKQYVAAMLYTSVAYSLGMIIGPFIGGNLQMLFGWQACFYAYAVISGSLLVAFILFVNESCPMGSRLTAKKMFNNYFTVIKHPAFLAGSAITGLVMLQQMIYPTLGPFILNQQLHLSAFTYGMYALIVGLAYLGGNLTNRFLIHRFTPQQLQKTGMLAILIIGLLQILCGLVMPINTGLITLPIILMSFALGFVFGNTIATTLALFPKLAGSATGLLTFIMLVVATLGVNVMSAVKIDSAWAVGIIISVTAIIQIYLHRICHR